MRLNGGELDKIILYIVLLDNMPTLVDVILLDDMSLYYYIICYIMI